MKRRKGSVDGVAMAGSAICALVIGFALGVIFVAQAAEPYRNGQIDALSGAAIWYELRDNPDGSRSWQKLDKPTTRPAEKR